MHVCVCMCVFWLILCLEFNLCMSESESEGVCWLVCLAKPWQDFIAFFAQRQPRCVWCFLAAYHFEPGEPEGQNQLSQKSHVIHHWKGNLSVFYSVFLAVWPWAGVFASVCRCMDVCVVFVGVTTCVCGQLLIYLSVWVWEWMSLVDVCVHEYSWGCIWV